MSEDKKSLCEPLISIQYDCPELPPEFTPSVQSLMDMCIHGM